MPPQLETNEDLFLDSEALAALNAATEPAGQAFRFLRPSGELFFEPGPPCGAETCLGISETPVTCAHGWQYRSYPLSLPQGLLGHLVVYRAADCALPDLGPAAVELVTREAKLRYELQSTLEELIAKYEELTVVYESAETVVSITDLDGVAQRILNQAADILDVDHASLMLLEDDHLVVKAARGTRTERVGQVRVPIGEEISGWVAREGKPVLVEDLATHPVFGRGDSRTEDSARSLVSVPLKIKDRVLGVLNVNHKQSGDPFNSGDLKLLMALASLAAISIENARTYQNAITDRLTSLYNYGYFREQLDKGVEDALNGGHPLSLLMFDIDHFKNFNDVNGHELANVALVGVASLCMDNSRQRGDRVPDLVARYGGEEFMILLTGVDKQLAYKTAERIRSRVAGTQFEGGQNQPMGKVTISVGVATFPDDADSADELINQADQALYQAKRGGRNNVKMAGETPVE